MTRFRRLYGAGPLHLVLLLASLALAGAAFVRFFDSGSDTANIFVWLVGAILLHDVVLFPLYSLLDLAANRALSRTGTSLPVPIRNHLRVPAGLSALLLLVYFPLIFGLGSQTYHNATGANPHGYLGRWLLITGLAFAVSALVYALRLRRSGSSARRVAAGSPGGSGD